MKSLILTLLFSTLLFAQKPDLLLLSNYEEEQNINGWYMSEKLDGVRAYWDGNKLISRSGKLFATPDFFTKDFPKHNLDGELWSKRGDFEAIVSIVNQKSPHPGWDNITYNIFEVPQSDGNLTTRLSKVIQSNYVKLILQIKIQNKEHLKEFLHKIERLGGEGVVIRDGSLPYFTGRGKNASKVKSYIDDECIVVGYNRGNGKFQDMVGSLSCRLKDKRVIKIGSGLSEKERVNPPKIGTLITFKYYGLTSKGNPRFPVFMRVRELTTSTDSHE
ncbi:DNA ligase [Sulfurimonas aquatica]|uniref:DNA ligase n=1 Tax=Sulfurimonas aquatica TaxID=2672570 RepID=A0A975B1C8_9BACT|nr:DNA ligase [Sulfurimonas aquatica]QSZ42343.1 DNA ligase [Sulfurimonas aquatica]